MAEQAVVTRAFKRGACWFVEGRVRVGAGWLDAGFAATARDVEHMTREQFRAFALRKLPECTDDRRYSPTGEVLV